MRATKLSLLEILASVTGSVVDDWEDLDGPDSGVDAPLWEWNFLGVTRQQLYWERHALRFRTRHSEQFRRRVDAPQPRDARSIKPEIETGANPDIEDTPGGARDDMGAAFGRGWVLHRQVGPLLRVSDARQPPMTLNLLLSESAGSHSLHRPG